MLRDFRELSYCSPCGPLFKNNFGGQINENWWIHLPTFIFLVMFCFSGVPPSPPPPPWRKGWEDRKREIDGYGVRTAIFRDNQRYKVTFTHLRHNLVSHSLFYFSTVPFLLIWNDVFEECYEECVKVILYLLWSYFVALQWFRVF